MKLKKLLCFVLILAIMMSLGMTAFADEIDENEQKVVYDDTLNAGSRSLSKPTKHWNLNSSSYRASLEYE